MWMLSWSLLHGGDEARRDEQPLAEGACPRIQRSRVGNEREDRTGTCRHHVLTHRHQFDSSDLIDEHPAVQRLNQDALSWENLVQVSEHALCSVGDLARDYGVPVAAD